MSLPPGFLDELRERVSLEAVVGRKVVWDNRKSSRARGDFWAPCPFHQEKSASFHILERQGFYKCFGCGAQGDVFRFVQETEGVGFMDAVRILAGEAGMTVPAPSPQAQQRQDRRERLSEVLEAGLRHYRMMLGSGQGRAARDYLAGRGLTQGDIDRFGLGYAPAGNDAVLRHLKGKGIDEALAIDCGLCARPEDGRGTYDRFRDRIVFPIRDARGRLVSLGGRAMAAEARAKYLNGPQTDLFDKGRTLYNLHEARAAAAKGAPLILAEGYMDVIALVRAGFEAAVAPLGTAITEDQLRLLWRVSDEPVVALDGDEAGLRSAYRLIDLALPLLAPGRSLRFAVLPPGKDPDDLLREGGQPAVDDALAGPVALVDLLWMRESENVRFGDADDTARLDARITAIAEAMPSRELAFSYAARLRDRLRDARREARDAEWRAKFGEGRRGAGGPRDPRAGRWAARTAIAAASDGKVEELRERVILAALLANPDLFAGHEAMLEEIEFSAANAPLADAVRRCAADPEGCEKAVGRAVLESLRTDPHVRVTARGISAEAAAMLLEQEIAKLVADRARRAEVAEAAADLAGWAGEDVTWRLAQAAVQAEAARSSLGDDVVEADTAENGLSLDRSERREWDALLKELGNGPGRRGGA